MAPLTAALLIVTTALTGGVAQTDGAQRTQPVRIQAAATAPAPRTAIATTTERTVAPNLRACYDGKCKLTLRRSVNFRVSSRFGLTRLYISFNSTTVRVRGTAPGVSSQAQLGEGGSGSVNNIGIRVTSVSSTRAVIKLSPIR